MSVIQIQYQLFSLNLCLNLKKKNICVSVIPAEVVFNLYPTLIILLKQQSSSHCHDVKAPPYYIKGDYMSEMRKRIDQLKETPILLLPKAFLYHVSMGLFLTLAGYAKNDENDCPPPHPPLPVQPFNASKKDYYSHFWVITLHVLWQIYTINIHF